MRAPKCTCGRSMARAVTFVGWLCATQKCGATIVEGSVPVITMLADAEGVLRVVDRKPRGAW